jgi:hypothetical protein
MNRVPIFLSALILLLAASLAGGQAAAGAGERDWNLAVVLDPSAVLGGPWQGAPRGPALQRALRLTLPALPLRVMAGVWAGGADPLISPRPAGDLQPGQISLPAFKTAADGSGALKAAAEWLKSRGGGTVLLVAGSGFSGPDPETGPGFFVQVLALDPGRAAKRLEDLAAAGGGLYGRVDRPQALTRLLRRALQSAVSASSLTLLTYDPDNRPVSLRLKVERADPKWPASGALSGRPIQLPAGAWRLIWPDKTGLSEKELPRKAALDRDERSRVWVGGRGELSIRGMAAGGGPLDWRVQVSRPRDGRLATAGYQGLPLMLSLPGGLYRVSSLKPSHQWLVEVGAGAKASLTVGPPGHLLVEQPGPGGGLRLAYGVISRLSGRRMATGYSGEPLTLPPGPYTLEIEPHPVRLRELTLMPGQDAVVGLDPIGLLHLQRGATAGPRAYELRDNLGRVAARGTGARRIPLLPGGYRLVFSSGEPARDIRVRAGEVIRIKLP